MQVFGKLFFSDEFDRRINKKSFAVAKLFLSDPDWIRTNDPQLRRLMLYPAELPDQLCKEWAKIIFSTIASKPIVYGC